MKSATKTSKTSKDDERIFDLLDSKIVNICYNTTNASISLSQDIDSKKMKLYLSDTGLFVTMLFNSDNNDHEDIYKKLLNNKLELNLEYLYENVVSQLIVANGRKLYYHTWPKDGSSHNYEIDFLIIKNKKVIPIEVKSVKIKSHDSIDTFSKKIFKYCG